MTAPIAIAVAGVLGRMGRLIIAGLLERADFRLVGGSLKPGHPGIGVDVGLLTGLGSLGVVATDQLDLVMSQAQVWVDFTTPNALPRHLKNAVEARLPTIVGTTGLKEPELAALEKAAQTIPVLWAPNMSQGVNLLYKLVEMAARSLTDFDLEIVEAHHKLKKDAPSGTALKLAEILTEARKPKSSAVVAGRQGLVGPRSDEEIGVLSLRGGDIVGDHTVYFCGLGERLELTHRAQSRDTFVAGALRAASWIVGQPSGLYSLNDALGLK
ncbi:MAG: 4-hydroxy-tetrahydrodipicolinate reductase [Deltaproteobacteria bacterium]|jgi:4-hydroxy-tetrahydrodipicolinate reductase|nr:4-hydroxy-tetrahydrodipicolinate reductase [Deltaproteobacteria bacterium]